MHIWNSSCLLCICLSENKKTIHIQAYINISSFQNGLHHTCISTFSILRENLWNVVMKCKNVMFFQLLDPYYENVHFEVVVFFLTYCLCYQLIFLFFFLLVVQICKIHCFVLATITMLRDCLQIPLFCETKGIGFSDDFRGNRSQLICLN